MCFFLPVVLIHEAESLTREAQDVSITRMDCLSSLFLLIIDIQQPKKFELIMLTILIIDF